MPAIVHTVRLSIDNRHALTSSAWMRHIALVTACLLALGPLPCGATEWVTPDRALLPGEALAATVAASPFIAVGRMLAAYDTTVTNEFSLAKLSVTTFELTRVLRGAAPGRTFRFVLWKDRGRGISTEEHAGARGPTYDLSAFAPVLICFEDFDAYGRVNPTYAVSAAQRISRWAVRQSLYPFKSPHIADWSEEYEEEVRLEIARQTPEAMAAVSERIVLARVPKYDFPGPCEWTVERTLKGQVARTLLFRTVLEKERLKTGALAILLARRVGDMYEPVRVGGGIVAVKGDRVPAWDCSLAKAIARITR